MKKIIGMSLFLTASAQIASAQGPVISPPDATDGVFERVLDIQLTQTIRPVARPESLKGDITVPEVVAVSGISLSDNEIFSHDAYLSENRGYKLYGISSKDVFNIEPNFEKVGQFQFPNIKTDTLPVETLIAEDKVVIPSDPMAALIETTLSGTYDAGNFDGDSGYDRLLNLAEGMMYTRAPAMVSAEAYVSDSPKDVAAEETDGTMQMAAVSTMTSSPQPTVMGMDPAAAMLNSLSKEFLANMTPDQMTALVLAAQGRTVERSVVAPQQTQVAQTFGAPLNGIPSLDYRGDSLPTPQVISAADVPAGSSPFSENTVVQIAQQAAPQVSEPMHVGDGQNLLMKGWTLGLTGTGSIGMYMVGDPGSIIEISEGMVVGPLGAVDTLRMENGNIIAEFSSGEIMTSPAALVSMASL